MAGLYPTLAQLQHSVNPSPQITISIKQFVNEVCAAKGYADLQDISIIEVLRLKDPKEEWIHVEFPGDNSVSAVEINLPRLWKIGVWKETYARWTEQKKRAERERQERFKREEWHKSLVKAIERDMGCDTEDAQTLAHSYLNRKDPVDRYNRCKVFGVIIDFPNAEEIEAYRQSCVKVVGTVEGIPTGNEPHNQAPKV